MMDERSVRLECLKLAATGRGSERDVLEAARQYVEFVLGSAAHDNTETVAVGAQNPLLVGVDTAAKDA